MNHRLVRDRVRQELAGRPGWEQHPYQDHHFRHLEADVHILIYDKELTVTFGPMPEGRYDKAVGSKTTYFASLAVASVLEVADALVFTRLARRAGLVLPAAPAEGPG